MAIPSGSPGDTGAATGTAAGAGVDCVYPIVLWETDALRRFTSEVRGPVKATRLPQMPSLAELAAAGVARVSWGPLPAPRRDGSLL